MTSLADQVLPLMRTRADVTRWRNANECGEQMHDGIDILQAAIPTGDPRDVYAVTHKALASAIRVIARADDSSGVIGDACRRLLALHPKVAAAAAVRPRTLIDWMVAFQFDGVVGYFELDPVAYAPALGEAGMATYRARLDEIRASLGTPPPPGEWSTSSDSHAWFTLRWNDRRLAVLDRDVDAIIRTHAEDRRVAALLTQTSDALAEIGEIDLAIEWARMAMDFDLGHQSRKAADRWCALVAEYRPGELVDARLAVFRRWPTNRARLRFIRPWATGGRSTATK